MTTQTLAAPPDLDALVVERDLLEERLYGRNRSWLMVHGAFRAGLTATERRWADRIDELDQMIERS